MANVNLVLLERFNNYFNRRVIKYDSLSSYTNRENLSYKIFQGIAFNPNDGIKTTQILNWSDTWIPDYLLTIDKNSVIISRWFVIEAKRTRQGQFLVSLKRDTVADYFNEIIHAPCFIEKAYLPSYDTDNPLVFNNEQVNVNQIKKSEQLLKDSSGMSWLVAYLDKSSRNEISGTVPGESETNLPGTLTITTTIENWEFYKYCNLSPSPEVFKYFGINNDKLYLDFHYIPPGIVGTWVQITNEGEARIAGNLLYHPSVGISVGDIRQAVRIFFKPYIDNLFEHALTCAGIDITEYNKIVALLSYNYVKDSEGKIFKIQLLGFDGQTVHQDRIAATLNNAGASLYVALNNILFPGGNPAEYISGYFNDDTIGVSGDYKGISIALEEVTVEETSYDLSLEGVEGAITTNKSVYDIVAIPYHHDNRAIQLLFYNSGEFTYVPLNNDIALKTITAIATQHQTRIYDIQLLPYCPVPGLDISHASDHDTIVMPVGAVDQSKKEYSFVLDNTQSTIYEKIKSIIFNVPNATFKTRINMSLWAEDEIKIENECNFYRLVSPNYNGIFEFSLAKNGNVSFFEVDCTYKPYNPYIHVAPEFGRLYGTNYGDARGLICAGDFSLSTLNDQAKLYEINNKNYINAFDREIEHIETVNKYQGMADIFGAIGGTAQGAAYGAITGATMGGGPMGAAAGAVIGGAASMAGGIADVILGKQMRQEQLDYTIDQFGFNLANIRALPRTLNKVSTLNANNKIFPFIEYYSCTDKEKELLREKMRYNGMTINAIGTIEEYLTNEEHYIKGKIIRIEDISEDSHLLGDIFAEINEGVFVKWQ